MLTLLFDFSVTKYLIFPTKIQPPKLLIRVFMVRIVDIKSVS